MLRTILFAAFLATAPVRASSPLPAPVYFPPPAEPAHWQIDVSYGVDLDEPGQVWTRVVIWVRTRHDGPAEAVGAWDAGNADGALRLLRPEALRRAAGEE